MSDVPPPRTVLPAGGSVWSDLALLGAGRWIALGGVMLAVLPCALAPFTHGATSGWLWAFGAWTWRASLGACGGLLAMAFALWRRRTSGVMAWAGFLTGLAAVLVLVNALVLTAVAFGSRLAAGPEAGAAMVDAIVAGLADTPAAAASLVAVSAVPALLTFVCYGARRAGPLLPWCGVWCPVMTLCTQAPLWAFLVDAFGSTGFDVPTAFLHGLEDAALHAVGLACVLAGAGPARRGLAARSISA